MATSTLSSILRFQLQQSSRCLRLASITHHHRPLASRAFSTTPNRPSQVGLQPIVIPDAVKFSVYTPVQPGRYTRHPPLSTATCIGPKGSITMALEPYVKVELRENEIDGVKKRQAVVSVADPSERKQREMWGTTRGYIANHVLGVSEGHTCVLRFVGVGYRVIVQQKKGGKGKGKQEISLKLGFSHPIKLPVPDGMTATATVPTRLLLEGPEKEVVMQFAANIRKWRKPEPYKGKGVYINDETIKLKKKRM